VNETTFAALGLSRTLLRALDDAQYSHPTAIQQQAIPPLLDGADLLGIAQTGTGKTAAFTLPLLQILAEEGFSPKPRSARALILAPTRELALQIADSIRTYGRHSRVRLAVIMGGVSARAQIDALRRGVDILIATPGRLLDLVQQRHVVLGECEFLVIDEADRMLDMGFIRDVRKIVAMLPDERQTLLFSATMPAEIARFASEILHQPERVEIAARTVAVERIEQYVHHVSAAAKRDRLTELLRSGDFARVIVFTRTKRGADQVVKRLAAAGIAAEALHGNKSQNVRQRTLTNFRDGKTRILVATDLASRGIDVDGITHVINYELPHEPESYIHRIGRTARAGASGIAISFCDPGERTQLRAIERLVRQALSVVGDAATPSADAPHRAGGNAPPRARSGRNRRSSRRLEHRAA